MEEKTNNLKISLVVYGQMVIFHLGIPLIYSIFYSLRYLLTFGLIGAVNIDEEEDHLGAPFHKQSAMLCAPNLVWIDPNYH